jgi:nucleotide-binding universal stress UspA family protein
MPVLVAIDGSSHTEVALRLGAQLARQGRQALTILTVIKHEADRHPAPVDAILARACEIVQPQFPDVRTRVRIGHPATEIVREAKEGNYDLVIVGEHPNRNQLTRFLVGSTAIRVVEHAPCPVVVAKGRASPTRRILLCDSGAESLSVGPRAGPSVLGRFTAQLAHLLKGIEEVTILHVMSQMSAGPGVEGKPLRANVEELIENTTPEGMLLEHDIKALERLGIHVRAEVRHGLVVDEILSEAQRGNYNLVVIGAYRGEGWQRILLDDLAHKIIVQSDRPVLVVR